METLGQLHAPWWNDDRLNSDWIPSVATHTALHQPFVEDGWDLFASRIVPQINPDFAPIGERLVRDFPSLYARGAESASTLIHGDYRLSNFLFGQVGSADEIVVVDWQLVGAGSGPRDLAYFLSQNLDIDQRREIEEDLVKLYHETLVSNGVEGYSFDQCWEDYLLGLLASMYIPLLGTRFQDVLEPPADDAPAADWEIHRTYVETGEATIRAMGERNISAIMDSGAADLLAP